MFAAFLVELQKVTSATLNLARSVDLSHGIWAQRKDLTKGLHDRIPGEAKSLSCLPVPDGSGDPQAFGVSYKTSEAFRKFLFSSRPGFDMPHPAEYH
jgi:hypothetical protein